MKLVAMDRTEFIADISYTANTATNLPTNGGLIPNERFLKGLILMFEGRVKNPAANGPTSVLADDKHSLVERIVVEGYHKPRRQQEKFIDIRGSEARALYQLYLGTSATPLSTNLDNGTAVSGGTLVTTASHTNDFRFEIHIDFVPENIAQADQIGYLLDCPNYENLKLTIQWGDDFSIFAGQTTSPAFTAYNSATGSPRCRVSGKFATGGVEKFAGFVPARVWRTQTTDKTDTDMTAGTTAARLLNIPKGFDIRSILAKVGVKSTTTTAGNNAYVSLSDTILTNIKVLQGLNNAIRFWPDAYTLQSAIKNAYGSSLIVGYNLIDFAMHGRVAEALHTRPLISGPTGNVDLFLQADTAGASAQAASFVVTELKGRPLFPGK